MDISEEMFPEQVATVGDENSTWMIELVVVALAVMVGLVYVANNWPNPTLPVLVAVGAGGLYAVYAVIAHRRERSARADGASAGEQPVEQAYSGVEHSQPMSTADFQALQANRTGSRRARTFPRGSGEFDAGELREETAEDITSPEISTPLFAESTMQFSQQQLAEGAQAQRQKQEQQQQNPPRRPSRHRRAPHRGDEEPE